ncbi:MAG: electron transport complex subunit RsxB [Spongiibacteraceae bacterium]
MLITLACMIGLSVVLLLTIKNFRPLKTAPEQTIAHIENLLPQTQCGQCGYLGCRPYAEAIANGEKINRCPPGGNRTIAALAQFMHTNILPLDSDAPPPPRSIAFIREEECIGCTKCIQACPVDAIVGAAKLMHTVIAAECTGCDLCVEPCPVDCIDMLPLTFALPVIDTPIPVIATDHASQFA